MGNAINHPRPPNAEERRQLAESIIEQGPDAEAADILVSCASIAVFDSYITGGPGYCGKVMCVVWDGAPCFFDVFTWHQGKMERQKQDSDTSDEIASVAQTPKSPCAEAHGE